MTTRSGAEPPVSPKLSLAELEPSADAAISTDALPIRQFGPIRRWVRAHPVWFDGLITALFLAFYSLSAIAAAESTNSNDALSSAVVVSAGETTFSNISFPMPIWLSTVGLIVTVTGVALRRVRPRLAFVLIFLASLSSVSFGSIDPIALPIAIYALAAYRPRKESWAGFVVVSILAVGWALFMVRQGLSDVTGALEDPGEITGAPLQITISVMLLMVFMVPLIIAMATGRSSRSKRSYEKALLDRAVAIGAERDQQAALAAQNERTRIAREMHDVVAHSLTVMIALSDGASAALPESPEHAKRAVTALGDTGRTALVEARRILGVLRTEDETPRAPQPGGHDVGELISQSRAAGLSVQFTQSGPPLPSGPTLQLTVYRIIQESLTNALRYAGPSTNAQVTIASVAGHTTITVLDDGPATGVTNSVGTGNGLAGIRERAALFGGSVKIGPRTDLGHGWSVVAELPWEH